MSDPVSRASLKFDADGGPVFTFFDELGKRTNQAEGNTRNLARAFGLAGSAISSFAGKAKSELSAFAGKEVGGSFGSQARGVLQLRDAITALAVSSGHGTEIVGGLKAQIQATAMASNQLQSDVTDAMAAFVERTSDLETARKNMEMWGKTATATGTAMKDIAAVGETLSTKFGVKDQGHVFDILVAQSKAKGGVIELHDIATRGPAIFAAAAAAGLSGEKGIREIGALTQLVAGATGGKGTAAAASVSVGAIFGQIRQKTAKLEGIGIKVQGRDMVEVLQDIIVKAKGDPTKLSEVFTNVRAFRGVEELAREYREGRGFSKFQAFRDVAANPDAIAADFATRNSTGEARLRAAQVSRNRFYDTYVGGIAEFGAAHANEIQIGSYGAGLLGKGLSLAGRAGGMFGGRVGGALASAGAQRVFVVNMPSGGFGGGGGLPGGAGVGVLAAAGQIAVAGVIGVAIGAAVGNYLDKHSTVARRFYEGEANLLGKATGQKEKISAIEEANVELNRIQLARKAGHRSDLVRDFEMKGLSHGAALNAADQQIKAEVQNLTVIINGDEAHAEGDGGTRSPKVMVRRNGDSGEN